MFKNMIVSDNKLYAADMVQIMKNEETRPASLAYISGYNEKSFELGMSFYNSYKSIRDAVCILAIRYICLMRKCKCYKTIKQYGYI